MESKIRLLDEHTINQIAAGEVIENPASVVKELLDNAIDSEASEITVEIIGGGRELIRVSDNGCGMNKDDALLCLERHATSKIRKTDDLFTVATMGFRGEALPSIASISKFSLLTSPQETEGFLVQCAGGKIFDASPAARNQGTTVEVKQLFYNVPVRRKFQRSPTYDANEIQKLVTLLALAHPDIQFELLHNGKRILQAKRTTSQETMRERIIDLFGKDYIRLLTPIRFTQGSVVIEGFIGFPEHHRPNRTGQYLFINKRPLFSLMISQTMKEAYGTALPSQRHPLFFLFLTLPSSLVDVNVHPQKKEVRLRQQSTMREMLFRAVEEALHTKPAALPTPPPVSAVYQPPVNPPSFAFKNPQTSFSLPELPRRTVPTTYETPKQETLFVSEAIETPKKPAFHAIATLRGYCLVQKLENGQEMLALLDQKAAHRRILFEELVQRAQKETSQSLQMLLIPHTFDLPAHEAEVLQEHLPTLNRLGFQIDACGSTAFKIDALPTSVGNLDLDALVMELLESLKDTESASALEHLLEKKLADAACRAALSGQTKLSRDAAQKLLDGLSTCQNQTHDPFGNPLICPLGPEEITKLFQMRKTDALSRTS